MAYKFRIINESEYESLKGFFGDEREIYVRPGTYAMSTRKLEQLIRIAELQKYYQCNPIRFIDDFFNIELLDSQAYAIQRMWNCPNVLIVASRGFGKALELDTRIPTPDGDKTIKDIQVGDYVFGNDGKPTRVINTSPIFYDHDCYQITFSDGEEIVADADHIWTLSKWGRKGDYTTREIAKEFKRYRNRKDPSKSGWECLYKVDIAEPLQYPTKELLIDPYILGLWLGDGCSESGYITVLRDDVDEVVNNIESRGYRVFSITNDSNNNKRLNIHNSEDIPLTRLIKELGVYKNKHIPIEYLYGDVEQRLLLLQGLMDTDGTIGKGGGCSFVQSTTHKDLFDDVVNLIRSLGYKASVCLKNKKCGDKYFGAYEVYFTASKEQPVFKLQRKYDRLLETKHANARHKSIINVEQVDSVPTKCLMVDNESHLFLCGNNNTITHNSTIVDLFLMAKDMLFCNYWAYIASGSGSQAEQTFTTLERIANDNIDEMVGSTGYIFKNEVEVKNAAGDGFSHSSNGFTYNTYNGSKTTTLNSNVDAKRGKTTITRASPYRNIRFN